MIKRSLKEQIYVHEKTLIYKKEKEEVMDEETRIKETVKLKEVILNQLELAKKDGISLS